MTEEEKPLKAKRGKFPNKSYLNSESAKEIIKKSGISKFNGIPSEYDRVMVAKDMLAWVKKDENINMCGFSADYEIPSSRILEWVKNDPIFRESYNLAKDYLGRKRELKLTCGELHVKAWDLNAMTYDGYLRDQIRDQQIFEAGLKADEGKEVDGALLIKFEAMNRYLSMVQKELEDESKAKEEPKEDRQ